MKSEGAIYRIIMNLVPAILYLAFRYKICIYQNERKLYDWIAILVIFSFFIYIFGLPSVGCPSTALDRLNWYFIPLQMLVFSRLHRIMPTKSSKILVVLCIVCVYATTQFVWLNFANHASAWLPYQNVLFN